MLKRSTRSDSPAKKALNIVDVSSPAKEGEETKQNGTSDSLVTDDDEEEEVINRNGDHIKAGDVSVNKAN